MGEALLFGVVGSAALVIGGGLGAAWSAPLRVSGVLLAFASGTLIGALAFELFPEAAALGGLGPSAAGLLIGAAVFVAANAIVDSRLAPGAGDPAEVPVPDDLAAHLAGAQAKQTERIASAAAPSGIGAATAFALVAAVTLDGVPENLALGVSLVEGPSTTHAGNPAVLLVAIFASNLPESLVGAVAMRSAGRSAAFALGVWAGAAVLLAAAVVVGHALVSEVGTTTLAFCLAFAGGAVLASLADTLMPEAFEHGRPLNAFATAGGFFVAFVLSTG